MRSMNTRRIKNDLRDASSHVEKIAAGNAAGTDLSILAHAIYNLSNCVADLAGEVERLGKAK